MILQTHSFNATLTTHNPKHHPAHNPKQNRAVPPLRTQPTTLSISAPSPTPNTAYNPKLHTAVPHKIFNYQTTSSHMKKPTKIIYENQEEVHDSILDFVKSKLSENVFEAYLFGSVVTREFGKYSERYGEHDGSDIDVLVMIDKHKVPSGWKNLNTSKKWWDLYSAGRIVINGVKHRADFVVVKTGMEDYARKRINQLEWAIERIK